MKGQMFLKSLFIIKSDYILVASSRETQQAKKKRECVEA